MVIGWPMHVRICATWTLAPVPGFKFTCFYSFNTFDEHLLTHMIIAIGQIIFPSRTLCFQENYQYRTSRGKLTGCGKWSWVEQPVVPKLRVIHMLVHMRFKEPLASEISHRGIKPGRKEFLNSSPSPGVTCPSVIGLLLWREEIKVACLEEHLESTKEGNLVNTWDFKLNPPETLWTSDETAGNKHLIPKTPVSRTPELIPPRLQRRLRSPGITTESLSFRSGE